jgi:hypothetical protein
MSALIDFQKVPVKDESAIGTIRFEPGWNNVRPICVITLFPHRKVSCRLKRCLTSPSAVLTLA